MPRTGFEQELQRLQDEMLSLGSIVESAILESVVVLRQRDAQGAHRLIEQDRSINRQRFALEGDILALIATQQPMAGDLRILAALLEIVSELERIADYAKGIAKITLLLGDQPLIGPPVDIPLMADKAHAMLHQSLEAFVRRDATLAREIPRQDDEVDALYNQIYRALLTQIISDPAAIEQANFLLWAAHNLERAADRVINICERVVFTVTGELVELDVAEGATATPESLA